LKHFFANHSGFLVKLLNVCVVCAVLAYFSFWAAGVAAADAQVKEQNDATLRAQAAGPFAVDGTFEGTAQGFGGPVSVSVTVEDGYLKAVDITSAENEDEAWLTEALAVIPAMLDAQTTNVDTVSGATFSSAGIINATKSALADVQGEGANG
jgi:uncharacterized protein with FMN-binding domain